MKSQCWLKKSTLLFGITGSSYLKATEGFSSFKKYFKVYETDANRQFVKKSKAYFHWRIRRLPHQSLTIRIVQYQKMIFISWNRFLKTLSNGGDARSVIWSRSSMCRKRYIRDIPEMLLLIQLEDKISKVTRKIIKEGHINGRAILSKLIILSWPQIIFTNEATFWDISIDFVCRIYWLNGFFIGFLITKKILSTCLFNF